VDSLQQHHIRELLTTVLQILRVSQLSLMEAAHKYYG